MAYRCCPTDWLSWWSSLTPLRLLAPLLLCPLSQPSRYFYLADPAANTVTDKESSELWAFSAAILPWIDNCDADVAATVRANADITVATSTMSDGYVAAKASLESVYDCMGITCDQVGGILEEGTTNFVTGFEPCESAADAARSAGTDGSDSGELSAGGIAGVTIAVGAVAVAVVAFVLLKKKKKATKVDDNLGNF